MGFILVNQEYIIQSLYNKITIYMQIIGINNNEESSLKFFECLQEDKEDYPIVTLPINQKIKKLDNNYQMNSEILLTPWGQEKKINFNIRKKSLFTNKKDSLQSQDTVRRKNSNFQKLACYIRTPKEEILEIRNEKIQQEFLKVAQYNKSKHNSPNSKKYSTIEGIHQKLFDNLTIDQQEKNRVFQKQYYNKFEQQQIQEMESVFKEANFSNKFHLLWENMQQRNFRPMLLSPEKIKVINFPLRNSRIPVNRQKAENRRKNNTYFLRSKYNSSKQKSRVEKNYDRNSECKYIIVNQEGTRFLKQKPNNNPNIACSSLYIDCSNNSNNKVLE